MKINVIKPITQEKNNNAIQKGFPFSPTSEVSFESVNGEKLTTPTFDGSGQGTHPDVIFFDEKWNGYHYWQAFTPYFNSENPYENPSIIVSNDGKSWNVPEGLINPVVPALSDSIQGSHHSDTALYFEGDTLYMIWRTVYKPTTDNFYETIYLKSTNNGVNWSGQKELLTFGKDVSSYSHILSPKIVKIEDKYYLYTVNKKGAEDSTLTVQCRTSDRFDGGWSEPVDVELTGMPENYNRYPWHINIYQHFNTLVATIVTMPYNDRIFIFTTTNPYSFKNARTGDHLLRIRTDDTTAFDGGRLYHSSLVPSVSKGIFGFDLYYGAVTSNNEWSIGLSRVDMI